jgi:hypothetical protein
MITLDLSSAVFLSVPSGTLWFIFNSIIDSPQRHRGHRDQSKTEKEIQQENKEINIKKKRD